MTPLEAPLALSEVRRLAASGAARSIREGADLTLREVAEYIGVTIQCISQWERGLARPARSKETLRYLELLRALQRRAEGARRGR